MKTGGRVAGATDGASISFPACYRGNLRKRLGCDEGVPDSEVLAKADGEIGAQIVEALSASLEPDELAKCLKALRDAGLVKGEEVSPNDPDDDEAIAADAVRRFMAKTTTSKASSAPAPSVVASDEAFRARFPGAGRIAVDHAGSQRVPDMSPEAIRARRLAADKSADSRTAFDARYPSAGRLK